MKIGQFTENVVKRSVLREIKYHREEILSGAALGDNCAILSLQPEEQYVTTHVSCAYYTENSIVYAIHRVANELFAKGAEPIAIDLSGILLPENFSEAKLKRVIQAAELTCRNQDIQIIGAGGCVTSAVNRPILSISGIGKAEKNCYLLTSGAVAGQDVVVTKWIGIEGTTIITNYREKELEKRFSKQYLSTVKALDQYLLAKKECAMLLEQANAGWSGVGAVRLIAEGGIYGALWNMAEQSGIGLKIELKQIPIRQETVEICNYFDINPYELLSSGSMLITADDGWDLVEHFKRNNIEATVIGKTTADNDRLILNEEEKRFLTQPQPDALYKGLMNQYEER